MNKFIKIFYIATLSFLFLPAFAFILNARSYRIFFIFLLSFFIFFIMTHLKTFYVGVYQLYRKTPFKYFIYFLLYIIISTFILCILHIYNPISAISYLFQFIFLYILPCYLLSGFFIPKYFNINKFIKFFLIVLFLIFLFGIIEYIGKIFNISFIINIQHFLANERTLLTDENRILKRLSSVFAEPGWLGGFIFLNFPIIYNCCLSPYKIFKNNTINYLIKKTLIPLAWLNILFTFSPIWLIFCLLQIIIIFRKKITQSILNIKFFGYASTILLSLSLIIFMIFKLSNIKLEYNQIERITKTIISMASFETFVIVEPSLASRIVSYINLIRLFLDNWPLGVGLNNSRSLIIDIFQTSPVPMTMENLNNYKNALNTGKMQINSSILYLLLAETGVIGTFLFYLFIYKNIKYIKYINCKLDNSIITIFSKGIEGSLFAFLVYTIYDGLIANPYIWFMFGMVISYYSYYINICYLQKNIKRENP